jgi:hypothetical protein
MWDYPYINKYRKVKNMMYLIIQETKFDTIDSIYNVINFTTDLDKANDMLQGYNLIKKEDNVVYTLVKYEQPLKLTKEMEC